MTNRSSEEAVCVRDARPEDVQALTGIEYGAHPAVHRDRIQTSRASSEMAYLVAQRGPILLGFGVLIFGPKVPGWPEISPTPQAIDVFVSPEARGGGVGTAILEEMAHRARQREAPHLYIGVEPEHNPRAFQLYRRLGFEPMQDKPRLEKWAYTDSDGHRHSGEEEIIDMRIEL